MMRIKLAILFMTLAGLGHAKGTSLRTYDVSVIKEALLHFASQTNYFNWGSTVFLDENALRFFDPDHSADEDRFLMLGISCHLRVVLVCHCYRASDSVIRIISARKADKREEADYWEGR